MHTTSISLIERLRNPADQEAWSRFVRLYSPLLFHWGRKCGLQDQDVLDFSQDALVHLYQKLPEFEYDRRRGFRNWLQTVSMNRWRDRRRWLTSRPLPKEDSRLADVSVPDPLTELEEGEYREHLVGTALRSIKQDFEPRTWDAFWQFVMEDRTAAEVARKLGLTTTSVYGAKFRILSRLREELQGFLE